MAAMAMTRSSGDGYLVLAGAHGGNDRLYGDAGDDRSTATP